MCSAPLRPRAVFCHRCGKPFPEETAVIYKTKETQTKEAPTTEEFETQWKTLTNVNGNSQNGEIEKPQPVLTEPQTEIEENAAVDISTAETEKEPEKAEKKQRVRRRVVQTTEYVWEEHSSDPTWRFALATVLILVFVFLILWFGGFVHF